MKRNSFKEISLICVLITFITFQSNGQIDSLRLTINSIAQSIEGHVGICMLNLNNRDTLTFNGNDRFPMQSVYKFPLALTVLHQVDLGRLKLEQKIHIEKKVLLPDTWSPLRDKYPSGNVDVSLHELITFTVSQSDNNACDILFRLIGGPKIVEKYIHSLGVNDIAIISTEGEMHEDNSLQYKNWSKPVAMTQLFTILYSTDLLKKPSKDFLWKVLVETTTGPKRIKGMIPKETVVAHKTGTGGMNDKGITSAINDSGIILLPNGNTIVLTVFVSDTPADDDQSQAVIAKISKAIYDYYTIPK